MLTKTKSKKVSPRSQRYQPATKRRSKKEGLSMQHKIKLGAFLTIAYNLFLITALLGKGALIGGVIAYGILHLVGVGGIIVWIAVSTFAAFHFCFPLSTHIMLYRLLRHRRFRTEVIPAPRQLTSAPVVYQPRPPKLIMVKTEAQMVVQVPVKQDETLVRVKGALVQLGFKLEGINPLISKMNSARGEEILLREAIAQLSRVAVEKCKTS